MSQAEPVILQHTHTDRETGEVVDVLANRREANQATYDAKIEAQGGRTDEEKTCQAPICVVLGGEVVEIPLVAYNPNRVWRDAFRKIQCAQMKAAKENEGRDGTDFTEDEIKMTERFLIDDQVDLVCLYMGLTTDEERNTLLDKANELELIAAYEKIEAVASPLSAARLPRASQT